MLRFIPDCFKTTEICTNAVKKLSLVISKLIEDPNV